MKLRHLLFGVLAGVAFAACTSDDDPAGVAPVKGDDEVAAAKSYLKVNFSMPDNAATRADGGFVVGTADENQVDKGVLFFFDGETQVADPFILGGEGSNALEGTKLTWTTNQSGNIEKQSSVIIVLSNPLKEPKSILAVLNADLTDLDLTKSSTLTEIKDKVDDYATGKTTKGKFVMSNSVYQADVTTPITKVYETVEAALADDATPSAEIYVERVVAKVTVDYSDVDWNLANADTDSGETASNEVSIDNGTTVGDVTLTAEIQGWWLDNVVDKSYLLKKLPSTDLAAANFRSYWAGSIPSDATFKHFAFKTAEDNDGKPLYVQENIDANNPTQVVVGVILKDGDNPVQLVKHLGKLYTEAGFTTRVVNYFASTYWKKSADGTKFETVDADDFTITYIFSQKVENATKYYTLVNGTKTEVTIPEGVTIPELKSYEAYTLIQKANDKQFYTPKSTGGYEEATPDLSGWTVQKWNDGMAYYHVAIEHNLATTDNRTGVIRNHFYQVKVNSINGLGTPVPFKDTDEIIPETPDEKAKYISAQINILSWKAVTQNVDLGK